MDTKLVVELAGELEGDSDRVWCVAWSPNGELLASCGADKSIKLWVNVRGIWSCKLLEGRHDRTIRRVSFSPNGKLLAAASFDATCSIWEESEGEWKFLAYLEGHENEVKSVAFDKTGSLIATCSRDKSVWIWTMESASDFECIEVCASHTQDVKRILWHPQFELLVSCSYDESIKLWSIKDGDWVCLETLSGHQSTVWDAAFNPAGNTLVSVGDDKKMIFWRNEKIKDSMVPWKKIDEIEQHTRTIYSVDWSKNDVIATGCADNRIRLFTKDPTTSLYKLNYEQLKAHKTDVNCVAWNPKNPSILASAGDDGLIRIWSIKM